MTLQYLHGIETMEVKAGARPVQTVRASVIGIVGTAPAADATKWPLDEPVLVVGGPEAIADLGGTGTLPDAFAALFAQGIGVTAVVVRVAEGADAAATIANVVGAAGAQTGVHALGAARGEVGVQPRVLIAPGFTSQRIDNGANPVVAELLGQATRRRAIVIADGPNTTRDAAVTYRDDWGNGRVQVIDPGVKVFRGGATEVQPASAFSAGVLLRTDRDLGFHHSHSNQEVFGITGTARNVTHFMGDRDTEASHLNANQVCTIVREGGWRIWGNETTATDPLDRFLSVRRTHDVVMDSVADAHVSFLDRPFSPQLLLDIAETTNGYLRILKNRGVTLGGAVWLDPALNTRETWLAGQLFVSYDAEAPAPLQHLVFVFNRNTGYYDELAREAAAEIARLAA
ncbi:MAG: phage tail sheath subtilisin-like domain-containing protein [Paracoccaceae bacterium]